MLRGGFGIYWNANQLNTYTLTTQNYPLSASVAYNGQATSLLTFINPTPGAGAGSPMAGIPGHLCECGHHGPALANPGTSISGTFPGVRSCGKEPARSCSTSGLMRSISTATSITTRPSRWPRGRHQWTPPNQLFGRIRTIQNDEYSHYNGFTAILRQRLTHGLVRAG